MSLCIRLSLVAGALAATSTNAFAHSTQSSDLDLQLPKEVLHEQMRDVAQRIENLRSNYGSEREIAGLREYYHAISQSLGGDDPARLDAGHPGQAGATPAGQSGVLALSAPTCGAPATTTVFGGTSGAILPLPPVQWDTNYTTLVAGLGTYLWDVNLTTFITHSACGDLDITLTSPAGTVVVISTDNAGSLDNCFNGTVWDDNVNRPVTDWSFMNNVTATPLSPEGRLQAFRGENPNGTWTLSILDNALADSGTVTSWSLAISTVPPPIESTVVVSSLPNIAIPMGVTSNSFGMYVAGIGTFITKLTGYVEITHTFSSDLDITLTSPSQTTVKLTTDNGDSFDNNYNGTSFDPDAPTPVTDILYVNNVPVPLTSPEGAFDNFLGQNPNGTWTMTVADDGIGNGGLWARWDLTITTGLVAAPSAPAIFAGTTGPITDFPAAPPVTPSVFTTFVSGVGTSLWDVDLNTMIVHTANADLDMTLTSPLGTVVTISTDNGGLYDNVFSATQWDDNVNDPVTDKQYADNTAATPLSPEGRLDAFRGENPNGMWTLTITDDAPGADFGSLSTWSIVVRTLPSSLGEMATTQIGGLSFESIPGLGTLNSHVGIAVSGTHITEIELFVEIQHLWAADLSLSLISPAGTIVPVSTGNGYGSNIFNGTLFDAEGPMTVTDAASVDGVTQVLLSPEGSFANFKGQDPNGIWTLRITDSYYPDGGELSRWALTVRTCPLDPAFELFCAGDGTQTDHTTFCPCGNNGTTLGNGCANSVNSAGANLTATGSAPLDDVVLQGSGMPSSVACIYLQGTALEDARFGDGTRCAGGTLLRLRTKVNSAGASSFPDATDTVTLSQRGGVAPGTGVRRYYQTYYRNAAAVFCPPETFNVTNGWLIDW